MRGSPGGSVARGPGPLGSFGSCAVLAGGTLPRPWGPVSWRPPVMCIWVVCCTWFPSNQMEKPLPQGSQSSTARGGFSPRGERGALIDVSLLVHEREPRRLWAGSEGAEPGLHSRIRFSCTFVFSISLYPASALKNIQWSDTFGNPEITEVSWVSSPWDFPGPFKW